MFHQAQATDYIDLLVQLEDLAANSHVDTVAINAGGSNWAVGDLFDINGGTVVNGLNATGEILTEAAGVATSIRLYNGGAYTVNPGVGATTTAIGPSIGTGLTVDTTILSTGWTVDRSIVYDIPERELIMHGAGVGTDEIYVGIQTKRNTPASVFYWELAGMTGFDNGQAFDDQPESTRQEPNTTTLTTPLNNGTIDYFFVLDAYHIKGVAKSGSSYTNFYLGFVNTFATKDEYPYPLVIIGCSSAVNRDVPFSAGDDFLSGLCDPISFGVNDKGPGAIRVTNGAWYRLYNAYGPTTKTVPTFANNPRLWPCGRIQKNTSNYPNEVNRFEGSVEIGDETPSVWLGGSTGQGGAPPTQLDPTPDSGGDLPFIWPTMIYQVDPSEQFWGELIDVHPLSVKGTGAVSEDTVTLPNGDTYLLFQNCNRTDTWSFLAIKRNF